MTIRIHPTADVSTEASIGEGTSIWHQCQVRPGASIGEGCILGKGVFVDSEVCLGNHVKVQNYVSIYHGVIIEDGVFIGPHVCFTNDMRPRAINSDGSLKSATDWVVSPTLVQYGASLGANSTIRCGITIGKWAMVGAGSVVTKNAPDHGLVYGNPARIHGFVCTCGSILTATKIGTEYVSAKCPDCSASFEIPTSEWEKIQ